MVNLKKTPLGETGCLDNLYFLFTGCLGIQFFDSLCSKLVTYRMPCHTIGHISAFYPYYTEKQRISLGVAIILSMCLCLHT